MRFAYTFNAVTPIECDENDIRILDGTREWNGRLEVCLGGHWGGVCEDEFEDIDAAVACRNLGYLYESETSNDWCCLLHTARTH